jgi:undecaprenyl-diphosphatase
VLGLDIGPGVYPCAKVLVHGWVEVTLLQRLDTAIFYFINHACSHPFFDRAMPLLTKFGERDILLCVALLVLLFCRKKEKILGVYLLVGLSVTYELVFFLKNWVARPRPFVTLSGVHVLTHAGSFSFPSSHATNAFLAATLLSPAVKSPFYLYLLAGGVAFSRIYLGVHYPSDTIAGALIGVVLGKSLIGIGKVVRGFFDRRLKKAEAGGQ